MQNFGMAAALFCLVSTPLSAAYYDYAGNDSKYYVELGKGFDSRDPTKAIHNSECFEYVDDNDQIIVDTGNNPTVKSVFVLDDGRTAESFAPGQVPSTSSSVVQKKIEDQSTYVKELGYDISLNAKMGIGKGQASLNYSESNRINQRSLFWLLGATKLYPAESVVGRVRLSAAGRKVLEDTTTDKEYFYNICGTDVVSVVRRGATANAIYKFFANSTQERAQVEAAVSGKYSSYSANANFQSTIESMKMFVTIEVAARITGLPDDSAVLQDFVRLNMDNLQLVREAVAKALEEISYDTAPIRSFNTQPVDSIAEVAKHFHVNGLSEPSFADEPLVSLYEHYSDAIANISLLRDIIVNATLNPSEFQANAEQNARKEISDQLAIRDAAKEAGLACISNATHHKCVDDIIVVPPTVPTNYINTMVRFYGWDVRSPEIHFIDQNRRCGFNYADLLLQFLYPDIVARVQLIVNNDIVFSKSAGEVGDLRVADRLKNVYYAVTPTCYLNDCSEARLRAEARNQLQMDLDLVANNGSNSNPKPKLVVTTTAGIKYTTVLGSNNVGGRILDEFHRLPQPAVCKP